MIQHGKQHGLEDYTFCEAAFDSEHWAVGKEQFAIGVAGHITTEVIIGQPFGHRAR